MKSPLFPLEFWQHCENSMDPEETSLIFLAHVFNFEQQIFVDLMTHGKQSENPFVIFFVINNMEL